MYQRKFEGDNTLLTTMHPQPRCARPRIPSILNSCRPAQNVLR